MNRLNELVEQITILEKALIKQDLEKSWVKKPIGTEVTRKDGKKYRKVSETGNSKADWVEVKSNKEKTSEENKSDKEGKKSEEGKLQSSKKELTEYAKNTSEDALNNAIKHSNEPEVRKMAHEELDRREKEEHVKEKENKTKKEERSISDKEIKENEYIEKFRTLSNEQINFYLDAPYPKVKDAAKQVASERGLSVVSKEDYIKQFEDYNDITEYLNPIYRYRTDSKNFEKYFKENKDVYNSLSNYKLDGFVGIRKYLSDDSLMNMVNTDYIREGNRVYEKMYNDINNISKFISDNKLSSNTILYRNIIVGRNFTTKSNFFLNLKEGDIYEDKSFSSSSLTPRSEFGDFTIKILAKKGSNVANADNIREQEYLIDKGSKFKVIEKHENGLGITVELL